MKKINKGEKNNHGVLVKNLGSGERLTFWTGRPVLSAHSYVAVKGKN